MITAPEHDVLRAAAAAVARDLGVAYAAIELACAPELRAEHGARTPGPLVTVPLSYRGNACGRLHVGGRLSAEQCRRLHAIAAQLSLTAHTVLVSRQHARRGEQMQAERRYLRRDLHDDLGPTLAAIAMTLEAAGNLLGRDPRTAERLLRGVREQSRDAVADLRRIVSGLRPSALDQMDLLDALQELAADVTLELPDELPPLDVEVELAVRDLVRAALAYGAHHVRLQAGEELTLELHGQHLPVEPLLARAAAAGGVLTRTGTMVRTRWTIPCAS